jgi:hypothetical protein
MTFTLKKGKKGEIEHKFLFSFKEINRGNLVGVMPLVVAEQILPNLHPDPFLHAAPDTANEHSNPLRFVCYQVVKTAL